MKRDGIGAFEITYNSQLSTNKFVNCYLPTLEYMSRAVMETSQVSPLTAEESIFASLGLDPKIFIFQLINFAIVVVIIWFLILKPLAKKMAERKTLLDESLDKAREIDASLQLSQQKYQEKIDNAKVEANKIMEQTREEAENVGLRLKEKTKKDIELLIVQARRNIDIERQEAVAAVRKEAAGLVVASIEKILEEKYSDKLDQKFIEKVIEKM